MMVIYVDGSNTIKSKAVRLLHRLGLFKVSHISWVCRPGEIDAANLTVRASKPVLWLLSKLTEPGRVEAFRISEF